MKLWRTMIGAPAHCVEENDLIVQLSYFLEKRRVKTVPKPEELPEVSEPQPTGSLVGSKKSINFELMHRSFPWSLAPYAEVNSNVRQRTDQIDVFTTEMSCLIIVWATIEGIALRKIPV